MPPLSTYLPIAPGTRFDHWTVLREQGRYDSGARLVLCRCDCGNEREVAPRTLFTGQSHSCGCVARAARGKRSRIHNMKHSREYAAWRAMRYRCCDPNHASYPDYGGRGIKVCEAWLDEFAAFFRDMGRRPSSAHSLDRIDNDGHYEPGNCRWAIDTQQKLNQRRNHRLTYEGRTQTITEWADELGVPRRLLYSRIYRHWTVERALHS